MSKPFGILLTDRSKAVLLLWIIFVICDLCLSVVLSCLLATLWSPAGNGLPSWLSYMRCFVTFPYGALGRVLHLIVSIPDICLVSYFVILFYNNYNVILKTYFHKISEITSVNVLIGNI